MDTLRADVREELEKRDNTPADWSRNAVEWASANKLIIGDEKGDLALRAEVTREQLCVFMKRLYDLTELR